MLIEPKIATAVTIEDIPQEEIWHFLIVARTVTNWCIKTMSALVQVCNSSDRSITIQPEPLVGSISLATAISENVASAVANNHLENSQARIDLAAALGKSYKRFTFNDHQHTLLLDMCTKYRSVFPLSPKALGKCTLVEAKFLLQRQDKPVDQDRFRTNPRAQEVFDKYIKSIESDGMIEKTPSAWGSPVCIVAKADGSTRF